MSDSRPELTDLPALCWSQLAHAARDGRHAWHTPALANSGPQGPMIRTVVLRACEPSRHHLLCHTDARSPKAHALAADPRVSWLFYDPAQRVQLRAEGTVELLKSGDLVEEHWVSLRDDSQALYGQQGTPGDALREPAPGQVQDRQARDEFLVIRCTVTALDWLQLNRQTHWRAALEWQNARWHARWINP